MIIQNVANFASSMLVSFIQNWQLTLMMLAAGPIMASVMFYMNKVRFSSCRIYSKVWGKKGKGSERVEIEDGRKGRRREGNGE